MRFTSFFIKHPVIAIILNIMIVVLGMLSFYNLTIREYPEISFPVLTVFTIYPNASPELVESSLTSILEDRLAGVANLETITSQSSANISAITLLFRVGTAMDKALSTVQDAIERAKSMLPADAKTPTVELQRKSSGLPFIGISLESTSKDFGELTHYAILNLKNIFRSIEGVSSVDVWGQPYTYTINLDPKKLFSFGINVDEIVYALNRGHVSLPVGSYQKKIPSTLNSMLKTQEDYENLLIKSNLKNPVYLKSLGSIIQETDHNSVVRVNGHAGLMLAINRASDANPLEVSQKVHQAIANLQMGLPWDLKINVIIDQSNFINASLKNIRTSIGEAVLLVLIIVFLFLRNIHATIIPLLTMPISLIGSFFFLKLFGFSLNLMTLLGMVLAIGLVVDDAIIVLENIWRHLEMGVAPMPAALKGAREIGFAIVAMTLTLVSVYLPIAFINGMIGQLFSEFAVALAGSVFISGIVALTLSPLMCATFLQRRSQNWWPQIDDFLAMLSRQYTKVIKFLINRKKITFLLALISIAASVLLYNLLPRETAPAEDRGLIGIFIPPVSGENLDTLDRKTTWFEQVTTKLPEIEIENRMTFLGDWGASIVLPLKPHAQRLRSAGKIVDDLRLALGQYPSLDPYVWDWHTSLPGIDNAGRGSELTMVISSIDSYQQLFAQAEKLKAIIENSKQFVSVSHDLRFDTLGYNIEVDHNQLAKLGLTANQIAKTIEVFFSGDHNQTFEKNGVVYNLTIKGGALPWTLDELYLTTANGKRVSIGALAKMKPQAQSKTLEHFQQLRATTLHVYLKKGETIAEAIKTLEKVVKNEMEPRYKATWTGAAKALHESANTMLLLLFLSLIFIYAILAVQFENFIDPFIIIFTVPLACAGALLCVYCCGQTLNIYTQIGLVTLIGLISKHGILITEFANQLQLEGMSLIEAIRKAAVMRLRPVLMTTGAMVFGAIPLILSHDAGAESRRVIGIVLIGGLCFGTLFILFALPAVYCIIKNLSWKVERLIYQKT